MYFTGQSNNWYLDRVPLKHGLMQSDTADSSAMAAVRMEAVFVTIPDVIFSQQNIPNKFRYWLSYYVILN